MFTFLVNNGSDLLQGSESNNGGGDMFRADSMGSLSGESSFSTRLASSSGLGSTDIIPVAMAVTETVHAYFQKNKYVFIVRIHFRV